MNFSRNAALKRKLIAVLTAIASTLLVLPATAKGAPAPVVKKTTSAKFAAPEKVTSVEGITEYKLANGLRVLLYPDQSKPTVTVNMTYMVGSRHENYGETGMAHLLEHLLFKGTPKNPGIDKEFNKRGMRSNGSTWLDRTNYFELFQATDENLNWALQMEADRMVNSFVAKKDLDAEMTVVRNEYERGENSPFQVLLKRSQSIAYDWHNYGNSTIGNRSDIENVKIENLQAFYRMYYQPDNAVLLVAGKFDEAKTLQLIAQYFGAIPKPARVLPKLWTVEPTQDGERSFVVRRLQDSRRIARRCGCDWHDEFRPLRFAHRTLAQSPGGNRQSHAGGGLPADGQRQQLASPGGCCKKR
jgi:zinc protease